MANGADMCSFKIFLNQLPLHEFVIDVDKRIYGESPYSDGTVIGGKCI